MHVCLLCINQFRPWAHNSNISKFDIKLNICFTFIFTGMLQRNVEHHESLQQYIHRYWCCPCDNWGKKEFHTIINKIKKKSKKKSFLRFIDCKKLRNSFTLKTKKSLGKNKLFLLFIITFNCKQNQMAVPELAICRDIPPISLSILLQIIAVAFAFLMARQLQKEVES